MPRAIEAELIEAMRAGRAFAKAHHTYCPESRRVTIYGRIVATLDGEHGLGLWASLAGYNTPRTRQTINALARAWVGRPVLSCVNLRPLLDGRPLDPWVWFPVLEGQTQESPQ